MGNSAPLWTHSSHCKSLSSGHQWSPQSELNRGDEAGLCSVVLVAVQKVQVCRRKSGQTLCGEKWPLSGGTTPEECRPLSLHCDGECRAAASGSRPSASSQSWVGFRTLSCCWRRGVQVGQNPGEMLRASGWDPPLRHFYVLGWGCERSSVHAWMHVQIKLSCTDWVCLYCMSGKNDAKVELRISTV